MTTLRSVGMSHLRTARPAESLDAAATRQRHLHHCTRGCNFPFAPLHSIVRNTTYSLSERQCAAATTNWGWRPPYGIDLSQIVILGGSVSCNRNTGDRSDADTVNGNVGNPTRRAAQQGWTRDLEDILRVCSGRDEVNVVNLCMPAVGTEYFLGRLKVDDAVQRATVVLVETAVNDDDNERTEAATEAMVRALLALPRRPFLLWVAASLTRELEAVAELRHLRVVREYGVGQVSVPNALRPSHDAAVQAFIRDVYLQDHVHPSRIGHRMIASVTAAHILRQQQPGTVRAQLPSASPGAVRLRARVTGSEELSRRAEQPPRYMVNLTDQRRCAHDGGAGRPAKPFQSAHGFWQVRTYRNEAHLARLVQPTGQRHQRRGRLYVRRIAPDSHHTCWAFLHRPHACSRATQVLLRA